MSENNISSFFIQLNKFKKKSNEYKKAAEQYLSFVDVVKTYSLPVPRELTPVDYTINQGLYSQGTGNNNIFFHLSAVYLNAYFGFYRGYSGRQAAEQLVTTVFLYWYTQLVANRGSVNFSDSVLGYNDGSTDWLLPV